MYKERGSMIKRKEKADLIDRRKRINYENSNKKQRLKLRDTLTDEQVSDISFKYAHGVNVNRLAIEYKCSPHTMKRIVTDFQRGII